MASDTTQPDSPRTLVTGGTGFLGVNVIDHLLATGRKVLALSRSEPGRAEHVSLSRKVDLLDRSGTIEACRDFVPTELVHLGARTDFFDREDRQAWIANTDGTRHVIEAVAGLDIPVRCVFASSMVASPEGGGTSRISVDGHAYTGSKIECERIIRADTSMQGSWCIVRPTTVWGPEFRTHFRGFFLAVAAGRYFHPGRVDSIKRLSYVGNLSFQIQCLLEAPAERIHERVFHLADYETTTYRQWSEAIARRLRVRPPRTLPGPVARGAALCGDMLRLVGVRNPPFSSQRLANMRRDTSWIPIDDIREITGPLPYTLEDGVERTVDWMLAEGLVGRAA